MPALLLSDVPADLYDHITKRANSKKRTVEEEALAMLTDQAIEHMFPCDLPLPGTPMIVKVVPGGQLLPSADLFLPREE